MRASFYLCQNLLTSHLLLVPLQERLQRFQFFLQRFQICEVIRLYLAKYLQKLQTQQSLQLFLYKPYLIQVPHEEPELNKVYKGKVVKIVEFGAFVNILPGKDGLLHISEISEERTENVEDVLEEGREVDVKLIGFDRGKMKLSMKALLEKTEES